MAEPWFSIMLEAKMRAMVSMVKEKHPDWSKVFIKEALTNLLDKSVEAVLGEASTAEEGSVKYSARS